MVLDVDEVKQRLAHLEAFPQWLELKLVLYARVGVQHLVLGLERSAWLCHRSDAILVWLDVMEGRVNELEGVLALRLLQVAVGVLVQAEHVVALRLNASFLFTLVILVILQLALCTLVMFVITDS